MGVDIHKTGADISALCVDDLAALGNGGGAHLTEAGDLAVLDKKHCLGDQVIPHNKLRVDNSNHSNSPLQVF